MGDGGRTPGPRTGRGVSEGRGWGGSVLKGSGGFGEGVGEAIRKDSQVGDNYDRGGGLKRRGGTAS